MKKFVSFMLCLMFAFSLFATARQKKAEAVATTLIAGYTISQILGAMALSATVVGAGYAVTDTLVNPDDNSEFTEFLKTVFNETLNMQKFDGKPPPPKPLSPFESSVIWSMLTKQGIEVGSEMYNKVYDFFMSSKQGNNLPDDYMEMDSINYGTQTTYSPTVFYTSTIYTNPIKTIINADDLNKVVKYDFGGNHLYIMSNNETFTQLTPTGRLYQNVNIVLPNNSMYEVPIGVNFKFVDDLLIMFHSVLNKEYRVPYSKLYTDIVNPLVPDFVETPEFMIEPIDFETVFKNVDMSPLNGLVKNPAELLDIINGVKKVPEYVYGKITSAFNDIYNNFLENPNFIGADDPLSPIADPNTGTLYFGDPKLDEPELDNEPMPDQLSALNKALFWLKGIWQSIRDLPKNIAIEIGNIFQYLKNFIERFWQTFTEWWQDNFLYHWTLFIEWLHTLPNLIANALTPLFDLLMIPINAIVSAINNIGEFLIGLPELLIDLLKNMFTWLFVPDPDFLKDKVDTFKENFTFIDSFKQFVLLFDDMTSQNRVPIITLDFSKFKGSLGGQPISMGGQAYVLDMRFYDAYRVIGDIMITAFVYLMFAWRFFSRLPEIISGGGLLYTADNKTNDIINKLEGKKK